LRFSAILRLLFLFLQDFLGELPIYVPNGSPDPGKVGTYPVNAKFHAAFRALYMSLPGFGFKPTHATGIVASELPVGPGFAEGFRSGNFFISHDSTPNWFTMMNNKKSYHIMYYSIPVNNKNIFINKYNNFTD
jgi:hypothetical protein